MSFKQNQLMIETGLKNRVFFWCNIQGTFLYMKPFSEFAISVTFNEI